MDERPAVIREEIDETRAALDRDLNRLNAQLSTRKARLGAQAQWWAGVSAVIAGSLGAVLLWPRRHAHRLRGRQPAHGRVPA
jgi:hypothetical protein